MQIFDVFRSFLPLHNPIGFGASDFIELALAFLLVVLVLARPLIEPVARNLARKTGWCMLFLAGLTIALRLALLPVYPVPTPQGADDFSYLLLADTLAAFVDPAWKNYRELNTAGAWLAVLGYTFQLYFDFSGPMDPLAQYATVVTASGTNQYRKAPNDPTP